MQRCLIMNKLISANYWFGCDWCFCEVGYLGLRAGQLSLTCAVVYLWNTSYIWVTCPRRKPGIQQKNLIQLYHPNSAKCEMSAICPDIMVSGTWPSSSGWGTTVLEWMLKNSSSLSSRSLALRGSSMLLSLLVSFLKDCLFTCIIHSF